MNYEALIDLWKKQSDLFEAWKKDLLANAEKLREHVEKALGAPTEKWEDPATQKKYRYVEIADMFVEKAPAKEAAAGEASNEEAPDEAAEDSGGLSGRSMTANMELVFGLSITLAKGPENEHRSIFNLPVGIRYIANELEYALFDPEKVEFIEWEDNIDQFTALIFEKVEEFFSFNPYVGPRDDLEIGFLKKH